MLKRQEHVHVTPVETWITPALLDNQILKEVSSGNF